MMNKFYATVIAFVFCLGAFFSGYAQTRSKLLNYQAVIIDPKPVFVPGFTQNSSTLSRKEVCLKFSFYDSIGMLEYEETQFTTTDDYGIVNLSIGNGNRIGGKHKSINEVVWDASLKTLEVGVSVDNCTNYASISKQNLYYTPYALYAESVNYANVKNAPSKLSQFTNDKGFVQIQDLDLVKSDLLQALANIENNKSLEKSLGGLNSSDILYPTQKATKSYIDSVAQKITISGIADGSITSLKLADRSITGSKILDGSVIGAHIANNSISNSKFSEPISVMNGGTGSTFLSGYIKGNGTSGFTSSSTIPISDVAGSIQKVNGNTPDANGNVTLSFGAVYTGTITDRSIVVAAPKNGDIYVVSGDPAASNNGVTFIYDGTTWQEITADQASLDARYLKISGGVLSGSITVPSGQKISVVDAPLSTSDVVNKAYVDTQINLSSVPDADVSVKGKIQLAGDLGGTAFAPTVPGLALKENSNNKSTSIQVDGTSDVKFPSVKAVKSYVDATTASGSPDADAFTKGKIKLTGDLGGTADIPTVPGLSLKVDKMDGKSLSTEDFTTAEKNKLGAISGVNTGDQDLSAYATVNSLSLKENTVAAGATTQYYRGDKSWQTLDKTVVGLTNVDNTMDADKPISTATQVVLDTKEANANKSTDVTLDATSDEKYPSVKAIKAYVDAARTVSDIVTKTADYTIDPTNSTILCDATTTGFTLTLPDPTTVTGKTLVIIKIDESSNVLAITPGLHLTTVSTITSLNYPTSLKVQSNGTSWYIIK